MTEEKILTKHPLGKSGRNISKHKYETMKQAIVEALRNKELTHTELFNQLNKSLKGKFSDNISWYAETVKLDLEARKKSEWHDMRGARERALPALHPSVEKTIEILF